MSYNDPYTQHLSMWEILVPTQSNGGKPIRTRQHREWDKRVRSISGGLTVMQPVKGQWVSLEGELFAERMIPVRIMCTEEQINTIVAMSVTFYDQLAILAYKISDKVVLHRK